MNLILNEDVKSFQNLFSKQKVKEGEDLVGIKSISPSKIACEVYCALKLQGKEMLPEEESFESRGYAEAGNDRHKAIQKFLVDNPEVEWVDIGKWVEDNSLPFKASLSSRVTDLLSKHPTMLLEEAKDLLGEYETKLEHLTQPVAFKLDGLVKYKEKYYVLEIKTVSKEDMAKSPLVKHQLQGISYSFFLGVEGIIWVYESRENFKIKVSFQLIRPEEIKEIRNRLNRIILNQNDILKLERNTGKCKYCRYKQHCAEIFIAKKSELESGLPF